MSILFRLSRALVGIVLGSTIGFSITATPASAMSLYIELSQQSMQTDTGMVTSISSGGSQTPTPTGTFTVLSKDRQLSVYSPWPYSSPFWFAPTVYQYALEFAETPDYGLYIHDAWWRTNYGAGSNKAVGPPGGDYTGTHGCINVPLGRMAEIYNLTSVGDSVIIHQ